MPTLTSIRRRALLAGASLLLAAGACGSPSPTGPDASAPAGTAPAGGTSGTPGDTAPRPPGTPVFTLFVEVRTARDTLASTRVPGVVVRVARPSGEVVARATTASSGYLRFTLSPGTYVARLETLPQGWTVPAGEPGELPVLATPSETRLATFVAVRP